MDVREVPKYKYTIYKTAIIILTFLCLAVPGRERPSETQTAVLWVGTVCNRSSLALTGRLLLCQGEVQSLDCMGRQPRSIINNFLFINSF